MSLKLIFLIGMIIFTTSSVGLGANLNTAASFNNIGSDNNISVFVPDANITNVVLNEFANNIISATITVKNLDSVPHSYNICMITKAGVLVSDALGGDSDCTYTSIISTNNVGSAVITFTTPLNSTIVDYSDVSIQQIT